MNTLEEWTKHVCRELGLDPAAMDRDLLLDVTKDVAHQVARPAAPLTSFLIGLAAGRAGGGSAEIETTSEQVRRLAATWAAEHGGDAERS